MNRSSFLTLENLIRQTKMKRLLFFFTIFLVVHVSKAQQDPQFTHNMFSHIATNPAAAGSGDGICATLMHRLQWVGFDGAPVTSFFAVDAPVNLFGIKSGVGLTLINDEIGFGGNFDIKLAYAYRMNIAGGELGLGINFGIHNINQNAEFIWPEAPENDIPQVFNGSKFDMGVGVFYTNNRLFAGISSTHLLEPEHDLSGSQKTTINRHYYATGGYRFSTPLPELEVEPSVFLKTDLSGFQFSINTNVVYNKKFWGGVSYRVNDSVNALFGLELLNGLRLGYSFDITTSNIGRYSDGSHEIFLRYCFEISVPEYTQKYKSARFL